MQSVPAQDLAKDPLVEWLAALEREAWASFPDVHRRMAEHWGGPEQREDAEMSAKKAADIAKSITWGGPEQREDAEMGQTYQEWVEEHTQKGLKQGHEEAGRAMVLRLASRKFGAETAERLEGLLHAMGADQLALVGDAVVDCDDGEALLEAATNGAS